MQVVSAILCVAVAVVLQGCGSGADTSSTTTPMASTSKTSTSKTSATMTSATTTSATKTSAMKTSATMTSATTTSAAMESTTTTSTTIWAMKGLDCVKHGGYESQVLADTPQACHNLCSEDDDCHAFTHLNGDCWLKGSCDNVAIDWKNPEHQKMTSATMPSMKVRRGWFELDGYKCSSQKDTVLFYPEGPGPFRVIAFAHGLWGGVDGADDWLQTIASHGFIVVAPFTKKREDKYGNIQFPTCWTTFSEDVIHVLQGSKEGGASLHPVFGKADWSRTGIVGHSRGAMFAPLAVHQAPKDLSVSAMVMDADAPPIECASCPSTPDPKQEEANRCTCGKHFPLDTPAMMTAGSKDHKSVDRPKELRTFFDAYKGSTKVYADLLGGLHQEVAKKKRLNKFHAKFLSCHVNEKEEDCTAIYGHGPESLCKANQYAKYGCTAQRAETSIIV